MATKQVLVLTAVVSLVYGGTLMEEMSNAGLTTVVDLLKSTGLDKSIENDFLTIFAPSDEAFKALPDDLAQTIATNTTVLQSILQFHATHGIFRSQDAFNDMLLDSTLAGSKVRVNVYKSSNQDNLFITLNGARVLRANIPASNGVLHVIDSVMLPPLGSFYELISQSDVHTVLKKLVDDLSLKQELETYTGTLFAPTDAAWAALNAVIQEKNVDTSNVNAQKDVRYHMLGNVVYSAGVENGTYTTLDHGEKLTVTVNADRTVYMVNQATVIAGDLPATNGVLHIIDSAILPDSFATYIMLGK